MQRMVYVNSKKFACESCIKGHRSSSCHHTDRPLFEIKKKGRPVSQCEKCRALRQSKKLHSKCTCAHKPDIREETQPLVPSSTSKTRRFIPIVPALPNGLKDVLTQSTSLSPERQTVDSLLNPCNCKNLWKCKCTATAGINEKRTTQHSVPAAGLSALATAAATMRALPSPPNNDNLSSDTAEKRAVRAQSPTASNLTSLSNKRQRASKLSWSRSQNLRLPPLMYAVPVASSSSHFTDTDTAAAAAPPPMPDFGCMPPIKQIASLAGSGCTCGVQCACPECAEHKSSDDEGKRRRKKRNCADGCGSCVDPTLELSLPSTTAAVSSSGLVCFKDESFLDRFFARAAALPPPPEHRRMSILLDPVDTTIYTAPSVNLPKLECCGGRCTCPSEQCSCKVSCVDCSSDEVEANQPSVERQKVSLPPDTGSALRSYGHYEEVA